MGYTVCMVGAQGVSTANTDEYWRLCGGVTTHSTTEANQEVKFYNGGTLSNFSVFIFANSVAATSTVTFRKNGADGVQTISVGSSATGEFTDATNIDSIRPGDKICFKAHPGAATGTFQFNAVSVIFAAWFDTVTKLGSSSFSFSTASSTTYCALGSSEASTTEANHKCRMRKAGTLKNLACYVSANRAQASTLRLRKNGANANASVSITGGGASGWYADVSSSDTVSAGEDWNYSLSTGTGSDTLTVQILCCEFISTTNDGVCIAADGKTLITTNDATARFFSIDTRDNHSATESIADQTIRRAFQFSELTILVTANDVSSASTCDLRINAVSSTNLSISITGSTTGLFSDSSGTDTVAATATISTRLNVPSVSGSHSVTIANIMLFTTLVGPPSGSDTIMQVGGSIASTANTTEYWALVGRPTNSATENDVKLVIRKAGVLSRLSINLGGNTVASGTTTFTVRKNGADTVLATGTATSGAQTIEDLVNSIPVAAGDTIDLKTIPGAATGTFSIDAVSLNFATNDGTSCQILGVARSASTTSASLTKYIPLAGDSTMDSTEAEAKCRQRKAGTYRNLCVIVTANTSTNSITFKTRKNAADGNISVAVAGSTTGTFEDTTHNDTVAVDDDYNFAVTTGSGTVNITYSLIAINFFADVYNSGAFVTGNLNTNTMAAALTRYMIAGASTNYFTTEQDTKRKIRLNRLTIVSMHIYIVANSVTASTTVTVRKNAADGANTLSIGSSTTGLFSDTSHTDEFSNGDDLNIKFITGATGTSIEVSTVILTYTMSRVTKSFIFKHNNLQRVGSKSLSFDGNDYLDMGNQSSLWSQSKTKWSVSFLYRTTSSSNVTIGGSSAWGSTNGSVLFWIFSNVVGVGVWQGAEIDAYKDVPITFADGNWHQFGATFDSTLGSANLKFYHDSILGGVTGNVTTTTNPNDNMRLGWTSGALVGNVKDFRYKVGVVWTQSDFDNIRVNSGSAPAPDYQVMMDEGSGNPVDSIGGKTTTINGGVWDHLTSAPFASNPFRFVYKVIQRTSKQFRFPYNVRKRISKSFIFKYSVLSRVSKVFRFPYKVIQRISKTFRFPYKVVGRVSKVFRFPYNVAKRISKSFTFKYNVMQRISKAFRFPYKVLQRVSKPFTFLYNVAEGGLTRISKTFRFPYNVQARVSKQFRFPYNVAARISKQFRFLYNVKQRISKQFRFPYKVAQRISKQFIFKYNVLKRISKTFTFKYNVLKRISKSFQFPYKVVQRTSKVFRFPYNVRARISKIFRFKYNVLVRVTKQFRFVYKVVQRVSKPFSFVYNVESAVARVSKSFNFVYNVQKRVSKPFSFKYNVRVLVSKQFRFVYNVRARVSKVFRFPYNVRQRISKQFRFKYLVLQRASKTFRFPYKVIQRTSKSFTFPYNVAQRVSKTFRFKYLVLVRISKAFTFKYNVLKRVSKQFRFPYKVVGRVSKAFRFVYNVLAQNFNDPHIMLQDLLQQDWPISSPLTPPKSSIVFGQWPNNQGDFFVVCEESPSTTDVSDALDISQTPYYNTTRVKVHVYVKSFNILSPTATYVPQSDPDELFQMVSYIEDYINHNPAGLLSMNIHEMEQVGTNWDSRRSWKDDMFHATVNVVMRYVE